MPIAIRPFPEDAPDLQTGQVPDLGDGRLDEFAGPIERRAHAEKFNSTAAESLTLADLIPQMQRRPPSNPERVLNDLQMLSDFNVGKIHIRILLRYL